jgi:cobalt transporter subunit CbtB
MQHSISSEVKSKTAITTHQLALIQIFAAVVLAAALIYGVGFASMAVAHNAAHDTRHAVAFPCH